jgi:hypothetical protein
MENTTSKNKIWWILLSIVIILILGFLTYSYKDSIKKYLGFATVYDAAANRAMQAGNDWKISSGSFAWGENIGWVDFAPSEGDTVVADNALWGYAYGENIGWISLNCANTDTCNTVNHKVSNNGEGKLSGFAWGENIGWVDFGTSTDIVNRTWGVSITSAGDFTGYAYGENVGWISFNSANGGSVVYKVSTNWRPQSTRPQCNNGLDDDSDGLIDYPDDRSCSSLTDTRERSSSGGTSVTTEYPDPEVIIPVSTTTTTTVTSTTTSTTTIVVPPTTKPIVPTPTTGPSLGNNNFVFTGIFTRDLYIGISGGDVKELQKFLNAQGYTVAVSGVGSAGNETTFYGNRTADAVTKLQEANSSVILAPYGLTKGTGYFGKNTRAFVNSRLNN